MSRLPQKPAALGLDLEPPARFYSFGADFGEDCTKDLEFPPRQRSIYWLTHDCFEAIPKPFSFHPNGVVSRSDTHTAEIAVDRPYLAPQVVEPGVVNDVESVGSEQEPILADALRPASGV